MLLALLLLGAGLAWISGTRFKSRDQAVAEAQAPTPSVVTAAVERRELRDTVTVRGTVSPARSVAVEIDTVAEGRLPVITANPLGPGAEVPEGGAVTELAGRPVFAMAGTKPVYRDIGPGTRGDDVRQLQKGLGRLGFLRGSADGAYGSATASAVEAWYRDAGYEPATVPVRAEPSTEDSPAPTGSPPSKSDGPDPVKGEPVPLLGDSPSAAPAPEVAMVPTSELVFVPELPARVEEVTPVGGRLEGPVAKLAVGPLAVNADVPPSDAEIIEIGQPATVDDETSGARIEGSIAAVSALTDTAQGQIVPVRIETVEPIPAEEAGRNLRVIIEAATSGTEVLVVPVTAVASRADGSTVVSVLEDGNRRTVPVKIGLSADGSTEVSPVEGSRLEAGDRVVVGRW